MNFSLQKLFSRFDWLLLVSILLLLGLSLAVLYPISQENSNFNLDKDHFLKQLIFAVAGLVIFFIFSALDYRILKSYSNLLFFAGIIILVLVLFVGKVIRGTTGWIGWGEFRFQPIEPFKIIIVIGLAKYFSLHQRAAASFKQVLYSLVPVGFSVALIMAQPDLGSALVIIFCWLAVLVISGVNKKHLFILALAGILICFLSWNLLLKNYQKERLVTLFHPTADPQGAGYNVLQSTVAVGSGGFWGKGLGHGSQSQLNFLPEKHTDFIFAVISEELGLGGAIFAFLFLLLIIMRFLRIAKNSRDNFGKLLVGGLASIIFIQTLVNIGMNVGMVPVAGLPLPFLSYGGSSLLTMMITAGIVENVHRLSRA